MHSQKFHLTEPVGPVDHVIGPDHAPVTLVEYGDFECPHCKQAFGTVKLLLSRYELQLRFAFRHYPLEGVHPHALYAAQAAECAGGQGRFWPMHDLLFANQQHLQPADIEGYARTLGLDLARFRPRWTTRSIYSACASTRAAPRPAVCAPRRRST